MLNKFVKKSIASKFFLMNLIILIFIIGSQLIFQAVYFEKYYLSKKEDTLEESIVEFKEFIIKGSTSEEIMRFMNEVKRRENIALFFRNSDLTNGYSLEMYMGQKQVLIKDKSTGKKFNIILGDQFPNIKINKGDFIEVTGVKDAYGYIVTYNLVVNGKEIEPYYSIVPRENTSFLESESKVPAALTIPIGQQSYVSGRVEDFVPEDSSYSVIANADFYLGLETRQNIMVNNKYITKTTILNSVDEMMVLSEKFYGGYLMAMAPLAEVNDVLGNMNSYYFMIFLLAFLIVIVVSLVYSRYMTKPLVEMSNIAKKISECDFQYKYDVKTEDEIGILGDSLNSISNNLEKSLNDLQESNEKLKGEMDIKNVQEEKRKELIANISHELKTPITIIQGTINCVKSGMYGEDVYEDILEETNKMNELVREMLEISKLESPTFVLKKEAFDLGSIFLKEKDKLKSMIQDKNLNIIYNDFDEIIAFGDEKRVNQVVTNFLTNAIKYTPENGNIEVEIILNEHNQYVFSIENFGISLNEEEMDRVWDPFYRKEKSRNKKFGGTGLGLSIVKRILEVHNSDFGVVSTENSVKFYFTIPKCMAY